MASSRALAWLFGFGLGDHLDGRTVIIEPVSLFGLIVTYTIALILSEQKTDRIRIASFWLYVVFSVATLGGFVCILRAKAAPQDGNLGANARHAYDWGSIMFTRWILGSSVLVVAFVLFLGYFNALPGQAFDQKVTARIGMPHAHEFKSFERRGIEVPVTLGSELYPHGAPEKLNMVVTISSGLAQKGWHVETVKGQVGVPPNTEPMQPPPSLLRKKSDSEPPDANQSVWFLSDLKPDRSYTLNIYLLPKRDSSGDLDSGIRDIESQRGITVDLYSKKR